MNTRSRIAAAATTILLLATTAGAATATPTSFTFTGEDFYIPRPVAAAEPGDLDPRLLTSFDLEANGYGHLIGETCTFTVQAANGTSVHPNNFGRLVTGGQEATITSTEDKPNVLETKLSDATLTLGGTIGLYNIMKPDADGKVATSVDYTVTATCQETPPSTTTTTTTQPENTTTTASESTTTTEPPTTTTSEPPTTSTTIVTTTSTSAPPATTTTTEPPSTTIPPTTTPTTAPPTTTSTVPDTTTTTGGTTSTTTPGTTTLPFTGANLDTTTMAGLAAMTAGTIGLAAATFLSRRQGRHQAR